MICEGSLEHCAKEMGINAEGLKAQIAEWNRAVKAGKDDQFGRTTLKAIGEGPYHIVEQKGRYQTTLGGLKADAKMRILDVNGRPIGNLFGAGSVVGGANGADALTTLKNSWVIVSATSPRRARSKTPGRTSSRLRSDPIVWMEGGACARRSRLCRSTRPEKGFGTHGSRLGTPEGTQRFSSKSGAMQAMSRASAPNSSAMPSQPERMRRISIRMPLASLTVSPK